MAKNNLDFQGQREGEELLFVFRRHIIAMRKAILAVPYTVCSLIFTSIYLVDEYRSLLVTGYRIRYRVHPFLIPLPHVGYYTVYIVTDQRIRQVTQRGFFW